MPVSAAQALLAASLAFTAGIFFAQFLSFSFLPLVLLAEGIVFVALFRKEKQLFLLGLVVLFVGLGMLRFLFVEAQAFRNDESRTIEFEAVIVKEPEPDERSTRLVVAPEGKDIPGKILVFAEPFLRLSKGDKVFVAGELTIPPVFDDFDYRSFLAKDGIFWTANRPSIVLLEQGNPFLSTIRKRFQESIAVHIPAPESFILGSVLLGDKNLLPDQLKSQLNATGTRHITAISGMHIAIFIALLGTLLFHLGMAKKYAGISVLLFVLFFLLLTGFQTSAVRAGLMGSTILIGGILGRQSNSLRLLVIAAALMLLANPLLLPHDLGFQLSFLAVLGILLFTPLLEHAFPRVYLPFGLTSVLFMSISAQVFTIPVLLSSFGMISLVSLLTNMLIVPLLPFVLALGLVFLLVTAAVPALGFLFSIPVSLLLSFVAAVIEWFSQLPFASLTIEPANLWWVFLVLAVLGYVAWQKQQEIQFPFREQRVI